jgi:hypothetical protein
MNKEPRAWERVWDNILVGSQIECWPWTKSVSRGYGQFYRTRRNQYPAHRVVFWLTYPETIDLKVYNFCETSQLVMHTCDNRRCCNPAHLVLGTPGDNVRDMVAKNRTPNRGGENHGKAVLTNSQAQEIKQLLAANERGIDIARKFGVRPSVISHIKLGLSYT